MADVKPLVIGSDGIKKELSSSDSMLIPLLSSAPSGNPPSGYVYLYGLTSDTSIYQKNSSGTITILTGGAGGGGGLAFQDTLRLNVILKNI